MTPYILNVPTELIMQLLLMIMMRNFISGNQIELNNISNLHISGGISRLTFLTVQYLPPLTQSNALLITSLMFF